MDIIPDDQVSELIMETLYQDYSFQDDSTEEICESLDESESYQSSVEQVVEEDLSITERVLVEVQNRLSKGDNRTLIFGRSKYVSRVRRRIDAAGFRTKLLKRWDQIDIIHVAIRVDGTINVPEKLP